MHHVVITVRKFKVRGWDAIQWHNAHFKFREDRSASSEDERRDTDRRHGAITSLGYFVSLIKNRKWANSTGVS